MGKVKKNYTEFLEKLEIVSIPDGKGKAEEQRHDNNKGKVSIPYGKGKGRMDVIFY